MTDLPSHLCQARTSAGMQTARLLDGGTAYCVHGEHGPWVVLVHGMTTPSFAWETLANALATEGFRVLRYDQFGRGFSDRPPITYDLALYVRQLRELVRTLSIEAAHFIGWSMGGLVVARLAFESPALVKSLTLIAPGLFWQSLVMRVVSRLPGGRKWIARHTDIFFRSLEKMQLSHPDRFPGLVEKTKEQLAFPGFNESIASTVADFSWGAGPEMYGVGNHPRPVLVVWGDQDKVTPYANFTKVLALFPGASLLTVRGAKHAPHLDHFDEVRPAVTRHLRAAEATGGATSAA